jgi:hypothetical protein
MTNLLTRALALLGLVFGLGLIAPAPGLASPQVDYSQPSSWLCRPGRADVCAEPLTSTVIAPDSGAVTRKTYVPDPAAPIDCFYVYPTVSSEGTANADMVETPEIRHAAAEQFARFAGACRTYAPIYRQTTTAALRGEAKGADRELAYADVLAAWRSYLAHDNQGRGVVLIGHSQGAHILQRLIAEEIDGKPAERLLVSAIIPGTGVQVPTGADVGGSFRHVRLCRSADQAGCVIGYSTYLATDPQGPDAFFGRADGPGLADACVNPGELIDHGVLNAELPTRGEVAKVLGTALVENPGLISAACARAGDRTFLAVSVRPDGVGAQTLGRALTALDARAPGWGLHALDVNIALGDLVAIVERQAKAWAAERR